MGELVHKGSKQVFRALADQSPRARDQSDLGLISEARPPLPFVSGSRR